MKRPLIIGTLIAFPLVLLLFYKSIVASALMMGIATLMVGGAILVGHNKFGIEVSRATRQILNRTLHVAGFTVVLCVTIIVTSKWTE